MHLLVYCLSPCFWACAACPKPSVKPINKQTPYELTHWTESLLFIL